MTAFTPLPASGDPRWLTTHGTLLHKWSAIALLFGAIAFTVFRSAHAPKGLLRRLATNYIARIDAQQKAMFRPPTGLKIATTQLAAVLLLLGLYGIVPIAPLPILAIGVAFAPSVSIRMQVAKRRARIDEQANGFALALGNALKATSSIGDALRGAADVTASPLKDELRTVMKQVGVGSTLEEALLALSARVQSPALDVVVSALLIGRQTGGDLPRILEGVASSLRDLKRLENMTDKVTRSAKQSLGVSASVTLGIAIMLPRLFPGFLDPLRTTIKGQVYAFQLIVVYLAALWLGYRLTRKSI